MLTEQGSQKTESVNAVAAGWFVAKENSSAIVSCQFVCDIERRFEGLPDIGAWSPIGR